MALADSLPLKEVFKNGKVNLIIHKSRENDFYNAGKGRTTEIIMALKEAGSLVKSFRENLEEFLHMCTNPLNDETLYSTLRDMEFDLAIVDVFPMARCLLLLPYNLDIPFVGYTTIYEPWLSRTPSFPSVVPNNLLGKVYTDHMTFWERFSNLWQNIDWIVFPNVNFLDDGRLEIFIKDKRVISLNELTVKCLMFLIDVEPLLDYPRPQMTNEVSIGGLTTGPSKPLPADLKDYMDSAQDGVILVSFGATPFSLAYEIYIEFKKAFAQMEQKVIWKYNEKEANDLSHNVKVLEWIPQNDILGHQHIKLFITHCGNNGQMEALYHGVPMIGFPIFGDQPYNCKRIAAHGFGICLQAAEFDAQHLVSAVNSILSNESYKNNIQRASNIFKDYPFTPLQRASYWINHVIKYGGDHMHSHALDMPWYKYLMLDVAAFFLGTVLAIVMSFVYLVNAIINKCKQPHTKMD